MTRNASRLVLAVAVVAVLVAVEITGWMVLPSWTISASEISSATPHQIWLWYASPRDWPNWDHLVDQVQSNGPFIDGTEGISESGGMSMTSILTEVREDRGYTEILQMPLASLTATHELRPEATGTRIDHAMTVDGPGAWLIYVMKRKALQTGMNDALHRLASRAGDGLPAQRIP